MSYKSTDNIEVVLLDTDGYVIRNEDQCESMKQAKERAKYLISDDYAKYSAETNHAALKTDKVEIRVNGECLYDWFYKAK